LILAQLPSVLHRPFKLLICHGVVMLLKQQADTFANDA
jgi:hypothetical protein